MFSVVIESELVGDTIPNKRKIMLKLFPSFAAVNVQGEGFCFSGSSADRQVPVKPGPHWAACEGWGVPYLILVVKQVRVQPLDLVSLLGPQGWTHCESGMLCVMTTLKDQFSLDNFVRGNWSCSSLLLEQTSECVIAFCVYSKLFLLP